MTSTLLHIFAFYAHLIHLLWLFGPQRPACPLAMVKCPCYGLQIYLGGKNCDLVKMLTDEVFSWKIKTIKAKNIFKCNYIGWLSCVLVSGRVDRCFHPSK